MPSPWVDTPVPCARGPEECSLLAEPEDDGETRWYACPCGYDFGHQQAPRQDAGACSLGVPESVRQVASRAPAVPPSPVMVQLGRRPQ